MATLQHDTIVCSLGRAAELVLQQAARNPRVLSRYATWLASPYGEHAEVALGCFQSQGVHMSLTTRKAENEFWLSCKHENFQALVSIGFDLRKKTFTSLMVAHFEGAVHLALDCLRKVGSDLQVPDEVNITSQSSLNLLN